MQVSEIDTGATGRAVWQEVFARASNRSPYLTPVWTASWLDVFASALHPRQLVFHNANGLAVGTCLLTIRRDWRGGLPLRRGFINTDGEDAGDQSVIEHNAVLAAAGHEAEVYAALAGHLAQLPLDELRFSGAGQLEAERLQTALPDWSLDVEWKESPFVDLEAVRGAGGDYLAGLSRNRRHQMRQTLRRYEHLGALGVELAAPGDDATIALRELIQLHEARWSARNQSGGFASEARRRFHHRFVQAATMQGNAHLLRIRCGERLLGVLYSLVSDGRVALYQSGFDYAIDPKAQPGMACFSAAIMHYLQSGFAEFDFLPSAGGEGQYKYSLANATRPLGTLLVARPGWRNGYFNLLRSLRRRSHSLPAPRNVESSEEASVAENAE